MKEAWSSSSRLRRSYSCDAVCRGILDGSVGRGSLQNHSWSRASRAEWRLVGSRARSLSRKSAKTGPLRLVMVPSQSSREAAQGARWTYVVKCWRTWRACGVHLVTPSQPGRRCHPGMLASSGDPQSLEKDGTSVASSKLRRERLTRRSSESGRGQRNLGTEASS